MAADTRRVLVVDDDSDLRSLVAYRLTRSGFSVTEAADGPSALDAARAEPPHLVVLDVMMPGRSGLDVCRELRADPRTAHVPVMLLTAVTNDAYVAMGFGAGAAHYMTKPFSPSALVAKARALVPAS